VKHPAGGNSLKLDKAWPTSCKNLSRGEREGGGESWGCTVKGSAIRHFKFSEKADGWKEELQGEKKAQAGGKVKRGTGKRS